MEYTFQNKDLLELALTHSSYANENKMGHTKNNERLEFLGDSVLSIIVSNYLYRHFPDLAEGDLTKIRAGVVCEGALAPLSRQIGLGSKIKLGRGEECSGGRDRDSILADAFEAHLGAMYLDGGLSIATDWLLELMIPLIEESSCHRMSQDYKTALQEYSQKGNSGKITYETISESGPDHDKTFTVRALIDEKPVSQGEGHSKKEAEQNAAQKALSLLKGETENEAL